MRDLVDSKNYSELYNCYALWIVDNRQYFTTGASKVKLPDDACKKPFGFRSFLKTFLHTESEVKTVEQDCSEFLGKYPDQVEKQADIFARQFPGVIKDKQRKLEQRSKKSEGALNQFFEQKSINFIPHDVVTSETEKMIRTVVSLGAKSVKSPEGWEIQF